MALYLGKNAIDHKAPRQNQRDLPPRSGRDACLDFTYSDKTNYLEGSNTYISLL